MQRPAVTHNSACKQKRGCTFLGENVATILYVKHHCFCNMDIADNIQFKGFWNIQGQLKYPGHLSPFKNAWKPIPCTSDSTQFRQARLVPMTWEWHSPAEPWEWWLSSVDQNSHTHRTKGGSPVCPLVQLALGAPVNFLSKIERPSTEALQALENQSPSITSKENCINFRIFVR